MLKFNQVLAVADRLSGQLEYRVSPNDLDEPWRTLFQRVVAPGDPMLYEPALWRAVKTIDLPLGDRVDLVNTVLKAMPGAEGGVCLPSLADMDGDLAPVEWLWPDWLPKGFLSLLGGMPGAGKSLLALDLARRVIHGLPFPDQDGGPNAAQPSPERGRNVIYVDAESVPQILNQRAKAWGLDRSRLYLMLPADTYDLLDLGEERQQDALAHMIHNVKPALVIVDSLGSISLRGENQVEDVRSVLGFLSALAGGFDIGLLLVHHLRKRGQAVPPGPITASEFRGSSHIIARAASVLALSAVSTGPELDRNDARRLEVVKTNLAAHPQPLGVYLESAEPHAPSLRYGPAPSAYRQPTQVDHCARWLLDLLQDRDQPIQPKEAASLAREVGYSRTTLYRARAQLGDRVRDTKSANSPDNCWTLASEELSEG